jgi:hypothetical protein
MDIDPIVLLAYVSVAINIITMLAACMAYAIFHVRKRRRGKRVGAAPSQPAAALAPLFLQRYPMVVATAPAPPSAAIPVASEQTPSAALAELR